MENDTNTQQNQEPHAQQGATFESAPQKTENKYTSKKEQRADRERSRGRSKKRTKMALWIVPLILLLGLVVWIFTLPRKYVSPAVPGKNHIHANLKITINGEQVTIPAGIGLPPGGSAVHIPGAQKVIHTHVENDQLHIEAVTSGPLHEDDTKMSTFFAIWGKDFSSTSILGNTTFSGGTIQLLVNGEPNTNYQNYQMRDGDNLEIIYTGAGETLTETGISN